MALLLESLLLCAAVPLLYRDNSFGIYSASCACGLQNAMVSTYSGAVVDGTGSVGEYDAANGAAINANLVTGLSSPVGIVMGPVPEPGSAALLALGAGGILARRRNRAVV